MNNAPNQATTIKTHIAVCLGTGGVTKSPCIFVPSGGVTPLPSPRRRTGGGMVVLGGVVRVSCKVSGICIVAESSLADFGRSFHTADVKTNVYARLAC